MNLCKQVLVPNYLFMRWLHNNVNINREMVQTAKNLFRKQTYLYS